MGEGTILGKTLGNQIMIAWDSGTEIKGAQAYQGLVKVNNKDGDNGQVHLDRPYILQCSPSIVIETNKEWKELEEQVHEELTECGIARKREDVEPFYFKLQRRLLSTSSG